MPQGLFKGIQKGIPIGANLAMKKMDLDMDRARLNLTKQLGEQRLAIAEEQFEHEKAQEILKREVTNAEKAIQQGQQTGDQSLIRQGSQTLEKYGLLGAPTMPTADYGVPEYFTQTPTEALRGKLALEQEYGKIKPPAWGTSEEGIRFKEAQAMERAKLNASAKIQAARKKGDKTTLSDLKVNAWNSYFTGTATDKQKRLIKVEVDPYLSRAAQLVQNDLSLMNLSAKKKAEHAIELADVLREAGLVNLEENRPQEGYNWRDYVK